MKKDKWITPDNYHFRDILDNGRCLWCGKLAIGEAHYACQKVAYCNKEHHAKIISLLKES